MNWFDHKVLGRVRLPKRLLKEKKSWSNKKKGRQQESNVRKWKISERKWEVKQERKTIII